MIMLAPKMCIIILHSQEVREQSVFYFCELTLWALVNLLINFYASVH